MLYALYSILLKVTAHFTTSSQAKNKNSIVIVDPTQKIYSYPDLEPLIIISISVLEQMHS